MFIKEVVPSFVKDSRGQKSVQDYKTAKDIYIYNFYEVA